MASKELSGAAWVARFPDAGTTDPPHWSTIGK